MVQRKVGSLGAGIFVAGCVFRAQRVIPQLPACMPLEKCIVGEPGKRKQSAKFI